MDNFKTWLIEVGWKKLAPSLLKGAIAAGIGIMATHQGLLNSLGITWDAQGHVIQIDLDTLSAWAIAGGSGLIMALFTAIQHHTQAVVTGTPQDGSHQRATDPPKAS